MLGVDPGSLRTGWAVVDLRADGATDHVDNGVICSPEASPLASRLVRIAAGLAAVVAQHRPSICSMETAYHSKNARSALVLGQARGAALVTVAQAGLEVVEYGPMQVKLAVTGHGRASKEAVQHLVATLMRLPEVAQQDASDAVALALAHAFVLRRPAAITAALRAGPSRRAKKGTRRAWEDVLKARGVV
ncbi:MAG: crossover junction endodeoxyribonuclease RuvC [Deltaproteobacteria bacterium]|nr:crossover junction endodeoxyribonuclease RuvC [Deltaproteobacteria bacterium]